MYRKSVISAIAVGVTLVSSVAAQQTQPSNRGPGGTQGTQIQPGESCPPGMTEIRPRNCKGPEAPAPSILDYRPKSTLIAPVHMVKTAKYPAIDYHGHPQGLLGSAEGIASLGASLDTLNVRMMVAADNMSGDRLKNAMAVINASPKMKDRVRVLAGIDFRNVGPGWAEKAVAQLEADVAAGAVGVGEIGKGFGLSTKKPDGSRLKLDDPELDAIWDACARLKLPVFIHTADPQEFFETIDYSNERWLELSLFPERRYPNDRFPKFEEVMAERDNLFRKHPKTQFVAAHMGWHANDLGRLAKMMDAMPNLYTEVGAVLYDIGRQPRAAHDFFVKYQDRILFGKDSFQPEEYPYYWRVFETRDDYFDYYRGYHAFWKLYGIDLPDAVLKKVYYQNALKLTSRLPQTGWPR
ncbi:MAG TPA: amidohydrolase family protein [Gemmatimonadaceae bacterium]|nr:amidohydrolase family protein [Gemmatimonadaceae bacterium]